MVSAVASRSRIISGWLGPGLSRRDVAPHDVAPVRAPLEALADHPLRLCGDQIVQRIAVDVAQAVCGQQTLDLLARAPAQEWQLIADRRVLLARSRAAGGLREGAGVELAVHDDQARARAQDADPLVDRRFGVRQGPQEVA